MRRTSTIFDTNNEEHITNPHMMLAEIIRLREEVLKWREEVDRLRELTGAMLFRSTQLKTLHLKKEAEE